MFSFNESLKVEAATVSGGPVAPPEGKFIYLAAQKMTEDTPAESKVSDVAFGRAGEIMCFSLNLSLSLSLSLCVCVCVRACISASSCRCGDLLTYTRF